MADPNKFKSISIPINVYKMIKFLAKGKMANFDITISKTASLVIAKEAKKNGYKNGKEA